MCASLAKTLELEAGTNVATYFFSSNSESREDPALAVRSWVAQLLEKDPIAFDVACEQRQKNDSIGASRFLIYELFSAILQKTKANILVMDGVDECTSFAADEPKSAMSFLRNVISTVSKSRSKLLVVSRGLSAIRQALESAQILFLEHAVTESDVKADNAAVSEDVANRRLKNRSPQDRDLISKILLDRCQGQFLWVRLQETKLSGPMPMIRKGLENAPKDLNQIYEREWSRIENLDEHLREWAISLLRWTACAFRPLTVAETTGAIMIDKSMEELESYASYIGDDYVNEMMKDICGSLLDVHSETNDTAAIHMTLRIPHFTIRQFLLVRLPCSELLLKSPYLAGLNNDERQDTMLAESCLRYLNKPQVWATSDPFSPLIWVRDYASLFWEAHAEKGWRQDLTMFVVELIMAKDTAGWRRHIEKMYGSEEGPRSFSRWTPIAHAVRLDLTDVLLSLIGRKGCQVDEPTPSMDWGKPLIYASYMGRESMVRMLLDNGADVSGRSAWMSSQAIHWAAEGGRDSIVRLLLDHGAAIDAKRSDSATPLFGAALSGHIEVVRLLLERGADPSTPMDDGRTPLGAAAANGHDAAVEILLNAGAACNKITLGATALYWASIPGHLDVVNILLERGADASIVSEDAGAPALSGASYKGHFEIVDTLLRHKSDVAFRTDEGLTALHDAADQGHSAVVELLIRHEADLDAKTNLGITPLLFAARNNHTQTVGLLLSKGAAIDTWDVCMRSALWHAADQGHSEAVKLLVKKDATKIATKDLYGHTALWIAALDGHHEVVEALLQYKEAEVEAEDECLYTPLLAAASQGHIETTKRLLADPRVCCDHVDFRGRNALIFAAEQGHDEVVRQLLEDGRIDPEARDLSDSSALLAAALGGRLSVVTQLLADPRVQPDKPDAWGQTPLFCAARCGHRTVVQALLFDGRLNPSARNWCHLTPLFAAVANGHGQIMKLLLDHTESLDDQGGFGHDLFWWAHRSGNVEVTKTLAMFSGKNSVKIFDEKPSVIVFGSGKSYCDACTLTIQGSYGSYQCEEATHFMFCLCSECYDRGVRCIDPLHELLPRGDGDISS